MDNVNGTISQKEFIENVKDISNSDITKYN